MTGRGGGVGPPPLGALACGVASWLGVTSSSLQAEGVAPAADWSAWERDGRVPRSEEGAGFGIDFASDLALLAELGLTHVRLTVEWARIEPIAGKVDSDAVDHYLDKHVAGMNTVASAISASGNFSREAVSQALLLLTDRFCIQGFHGIGHMRIGEQRFRLLSSRRQSDGRTRRKDLAHRTHAGAAGCEDISRYDPRDLPASIRSTVAGIAVSDCRVLRKR